MDRMKRQTPFLRTLFREADKRRRQSLLEHSNKDQINAVSELVLNVLKKRVPVSPQIIRTLDPYKTTLRELAKRKQSLKRRKQLLIRQTGGAFWKGLEGCHRQCRM